MDTVRKATVSMEELFQSAMKGRWEDVVKAYGQSSEVAEFKITKSGDTALHIAVSDSETEFVRQLVDIVGNNASKTLRIKNVKGNTPLHVAAALGDVKMCHAMASKDGTLVSSHNNEDETPLFLAALNGHEEAFLCLHFHCEEEFQYLLRARNGDTILHAAISSENFSLALKIIKWHRTLVNSLNESGLSPLHILAKTPTAFKSSSRLRPLDRCVYFCLIVEKLEMEEYDNETCPHEKKRFNIVGSSENLASTKPRGHKLCCSLNLLKSRNKKEDTRDAENPQEKSRSMQVTNQPEGRGRENHPKYIYASFVKFFSLIKEALLVISRNLPGISDIQKIHEEKRRHIWATQVMNNMIEHTNSYINVPSSDEHQPQAIDLKEFEDEQKNPVTMTEEQAGSTSRSTSGTEEKKDKSLGDKKNEIDERQTPILIAAKMGVSEMVEQILEKFPVAIQDVDSENKNVALLAVENRQPHVFNFLLQKEKKIASLLRQADNKGNNALHLAATYGSYRPWLTPGAALQMQWEHKWYTFVQDHMLPRLSVKENIEGHTPQEIFNDTHKPLQDAGSTWLVKTSESCSVVAALIATVAFATSASVPGGLDDKTGEPVFKDKPAFNAFTISSLVALCLSVTALVFFLSILTARYEATDFSMNLPRKLLLGLTSLFASIASVLVSFCTGHIYLLDRQLRYVAYPLYAATCLPVTIFALAQLPLYYDLIRVIFKKVPQRSYKEYKR